MGITSKLPVLCVVAVIVASPAAFAAPACPTTITVSQSPAKIPQNFTAYTDGNPPTKMPPHATEHPLENIMFTEGPPEEQGWLAPDSTENLVSTYDLTGDTNSKSIFLICAYESTDIIVATPLPPGIKTCRVQSVKDDAGPPILTCDPPI